MGVPPWVDAYRKNAYATSFSAEGRQSCVEAHGGQRTDIGTVGLEKREEDDLAALLRHTHHVPILVAEGKERRS